MSQDSRPHQEDSVGFVYRFCVLQSSFRSHQCAVSPVKITNTQYNVHTVRQIPYSMAEEDVLKVGAELKGQVSNVTDYGAFVDLGQYGSGLVHISEITTSFVRNVASHVSKGDIVRVRVIGINKQNGRISLSMKQSKYNDVTGYDRVVQLGGDWGHPWNDDGTANYIDLGPRPKGRNPWEPDLSLFEPWVDPDMPSNTQSPD